MVGGRDVGCNFDTDLRNTAEAVMPTQEETVSTALSILLGVRLGEEGSRLAHTHHFPKFCIS